MTMDRVDKANRAFADLLEYAGELEDIAAGHETVIESLKNTETHSERSEEDRLWAITAVDGAAFLCRNHAENIRRMVARGQD